MLGLCEALTIISIHALLAESDPGSLTQLLERKYFYPRSPCGERPLDRCNGQGPDDFYPRSPCGERPKAQDEYKDTVTISIHALLAESDIADCTKFYAFGDFYPRSPCGERPMATASKNRYLHFYPRSPCGERRMSRCTVAGSCRISIHALLAESDINVMRNMSVSCDFYPRSPCGERPRRGGQASASANFYPRSPCGERHIAKYPRHLRRSFLSTLSLRRATAKVHKTVGYFCAYETIFLEIASSC